MEIVSEILCMLTSVICLTLLYVLYKLGKEAVRWKFLYGVTNKKLLEAETKLKRNKI